MRIRGQLILLGVVAAIVAVIIAGVGILQLEGFLRPVPTVPRRSEMVGDWVHRHGPARLELFADGTLIVTGVPKALLLGTDDSEGRHRGRWDHLVSTSGAWERPTNEGQAFPVMDFFTKLGAGRSWIEGRSRHSRRIMLIYGDDGEYRYAFHRVSGMP